MNIQMPGKTVEEEYKVFFIILRKNNKIVDTCETKSIAHMNDKSWRDASDNNGKYYAKYCQYQHYN